MYDPDLFSRVPLRCTCNLSLPAVTCLRSEILIDEARTAMPPRYARPIMGYDWAFALCWIPFVHCSHIIAIAPCDSMTRVGEGRTHDTAWLAVDASTVSILRSADTHTCVRMHHTIDFSFMSHDRTHVCARVYVEPRVSEVARSNSVTIYALTRTFLNRYDNTITATCVSRNRV